MATDFQSIPTVRTGTSLRTRNIFASPDSRRYATSLLIIDGTLSRDIGETPTSLVRAGNLLGKVTTGGKYRPSVIGVTPAISSATVTSLTVSAAVATEMARLIALAGTTVSVAIVGPPTAAGTVASTTIPVTAASGTTLTITSTAVPAYVVNSLIVPTDGSQIPLTVLEDAAGKDFADTAGASIDQFLNRYLIGADLLASAILCGGVALSALDASTQAYIKRQLNGASVPTTASPTSSRFTFDNDR